MNSDNGHPAPRFYALGSVQVSSELLMWYLNGYAHMSLHRASLELCAYNTYSINNPVVTLSSAILF